VDAGRTREIYAEAFDMILEGLRTGVVDHEGEHFRYSGYLLPVRTRQRPYPPLWYPTTNADTIPWLGRNAINTLFGFVCDLAWARIGSSVGAQTAIYERELAAGGDDHLWRERNGRDHYHSTFEDAIERGFFVVGSPATVATRITAQVTESGGNYFAAVFTYGTLTPTQSLHSIELFATKVIPQVHRSLRAD
jgi:alkanesulfonate monooxygenase SsuD/methylene tetrahydromethanopterin reductase-like flavin-dependent oxidoreductase (luciferase family)